MGAVGGHNQLLTMDQDEKRMLCEILDALWGAIDAAGELAAMNCDSQDDRAVRIQRGLDRSADRLLELKARYEIE